METVIATFLSKGRPEPKTYTVCFECKIKENNCLLKRNLPCLGPITAGGCGAICPTNSLECFGCYGKLAGTNWTAMKKNLQERCGQEEAEKHQRIFLKNSLVKRKMIEN